MAKLLEGKVAVVTGAGRGIGRAIALELAAQGAKVVVNDLGGAMDGSGNSQAPADQVVTEIEKMGGAAVANYDSVASIEGGQRIVQTAIDSFGKIDILVNNAGILRDRMIFNMTEEEWDSVITVHLKGNFCCTKAACAQFKQQRSGRIISLSSGVALGNSGQANYGAAKAGILGFIRCVAKDMGKYGVTANAIWPQADTRLTVTPEVRARHQRGELPTPTLMRDPACIAPVVAYLASDEASNINGQTIQVTGGIITLIAPETETKTIYKDGKWEVEELRQVFPASISKELRSEYKGLAPV